MNAMKNQKKADEKSPSAGAFRRIVTGHDDQGRSIVVTAGPAPTILDVGGELGAVFHEVWNTAASPAPIRRGAEEAVGTAITLNPPPNGTRLRVIEFRPGDRDMTAEEARKAFAAFGGSHSLESEGAGKRHPLMHRTETVDYGIVLDGEIVMLLDEGEVVARAGDIVVQRGTNHAWVNRSDRPCRMAFILIDGRFADDLL